MKNTTCTAAHCAHKTLPGLSKNICAFHWAKGIWGIEWAAKCHPDHPEAKAYARESGKVPA